MTFPLTVAKIPRNPRLFCGYACGYQKMAAHGKLKAIAVTRLTTPGMYSDGGGLYLQIKNGGKSWIYRFMLNGRARYYGLGSFELCSLAEAREKALECRKLVAQGIAPIEKNLEEQRSKILVAAKQMTFAECAVKYIDAQRSGWKNPKHATQWESTINTYANPVFGELSVADVDLTLVLKVLEPIWNTKNETASRVRGRIESILDWATVRKYRQGDNPARWKGHLDHILPAPAKVQTTEHHAALPYANMSSFMAELRQCKGIAARALEFTILTAARSGEVRGAEWSEVDMASKTWTIPAARMKAGKEHRIPLSDSAYKLLASMPQVIGSSYIFPSTKNSALSDMSMTAVLRRMGHTEITVHGFRSSFRDWAAETTAFSREVIEHAMAHQLKDKAEAAYQRGDLLVKRAKLMQAWADHCAYSPGMAEVTSINTINAKIA